MPNPRRILEGCQRCHLQLARSAICVSILFVMEDYTTISTETWKVRLPTNWSELGSATKHAVYFESADGTMGAYFSTWCFNDDPRSMGEILRSFHLVEVETLHEMKDRRWLSIDEWSSDTPELSVLRADFLDRQNHYRIACHLIASMPWVVRSAFHHYDCTDYEKSKQFFEPLIESLQIHHEET
jgi:hypothetical protein